MTDSDHDPFAQAACGDLAALRDLLKRYGPAVQKRLAGKIGRRWRSVMDADDVMQVTYLEAFLQIDQLVERNAASLTAWLTRAAENNLRDAIRGLQCQKRPQPERRVQPEGGEDSYIALVEMLGGTTTTPSRHAARDEAASMLESAIRKLPADYREAVQLYDLEGRSAAEVAESMRRSVGAVHMLRARAHDRLREQLGSESKYFTHAG